MDEQLVKAFADLYQGRTDCWGGVEGKSNKEPVTLDNYRSHLESKISLGVYMLLDNGHCHFAAVDLDEKVFDKALAIKNELKGMGIPAYISNSRSKGYHTTVFAEKQFLAKDIRRILTHVTNKLSIKAEIFPKQDKLDKTTPFGNYINLPCFGDKRQFLTDDQKPITTAMAVSLIKRVPDSIIKTALKQLPPEPKPQAAPAGEKEKGKRGPKTKHPPCIIEILHGVLQGGRDEAAFALARHYLDQQYTEDEVLALLKEWDLKNKPPFNDDKALEIKLRSALKGYAFGCNSIRKGILAPTCVGEDKCQWLQESMKDKKKKGLLKDTTFYETPEYLYEEVIRDLYSGSPEAVFAAYNKNTGEISKTGALEMGEITIIPMLSQEITEGAVLLPDNIADYGDTLKLVKDIREHIHKYVDMDDMKEEFAAWYVLMTWVADRLRTVGYYRFSGDTGSGKSRALDVVGRLCYKPMVLAGAITPAPIYRLIRRFRGTLVLDEADFSDSSEKGEVVKILNCGFEKGRPIVRCTKDNPDSLEILPCFGPKVFASRYTFDDVALEARCITTTMSETEREDIISILDDIFFREEMNLRNKLLLWRMHHYGKIEYNTIRTIDLNLNGKKLEPRLKQTSLPYALMFIDMPEVHARFREFIHDYQEELIATRAEEEQGKIVNAFFALAAEHGKHYVSSSMICSHLNEKFKMDIKSQRMGKILKSLQMTAHRKHFSGKQQRYVVWDPVIMRKLRRRYIVDKNEYASLFEEQTSSEEDLDLEV